MPRDLIKVDPTLAAATHARDLLNWAAALKSAMQQGQNLLAVMGHMNDGVVWTDIETFFGLPSGKGQTVFNMVNGANTAIAGTGTSTGAKDATELLG